MHAGANGAAEARVQSEKGNATYVVLAPRSPKHAQEQLVAGLNLKFQSTSAAQ